MRVHIEKLVTGGQGLGVLPDGRKVFVWNAVPGEVVEVELLHEKRSFAEAVAARVIEPSPDRVEPKEESFLSTSPWQIISDDAEERFKIEILREQFKRAHLDDSIVPSRIATDKKMYGYRNKVQFGFAYDRELQLAVTGRRSHEKMTVRESALARPELNCAAQDLLTILRQLKIPLAELSHLTVRCTQEGRVAACLTVRTARFPELSVPASMAGLQVRFINGFGRKHRTQILQVSGESALHDELLGLSFHYAPTSFFQVNLPVYEMALKDIRASLAGKDVVELYAGVGSIGLTSGAHNVTLVDIDHLNTGFAEENLRKAGVSGEVVTSSSEKALQYIQPDRAVIVDPPRAGLSPQVVSRLMTVLPPQVIYLSCDPATLARDLSKLSAAYKIDIVRAYNFFPRTPHIETLVVLEKHRERV